MPIHPSISPLFLSLNTLAFIQHVVSGSAALAPDSTLVTRAGRTPLSEPAPRGGRDTPGPSPGRPELGADVPTRPERLPLPVLTLLLLQKVGLVK